MRQHAVSCLNEHQRDVENRGDGESGSEGGRRMAMTMVVITVATMEMTVVMLMRVMRRHVFGS
jgi:hypothetical protein